MNTNLAMGVQPLQIPDQAAGYQKALTMAALLGQQDLQKFQLAGAQRDQEKTQRIQQIAAESNGDYMTMRDRLAKAGYVNESLQLDKEINAGKKAGTDYQVSQADLSKKQSELAQGLSAGFTSLTPEQQQQAYPQFASEWKRMGLPNADKVPDQWNPQMLPHLQMIARQGIAPKDAADRQEYADAGASPASPGATTMRDFTQAMPTQPQDLDHEGNVIKMQDEMLAAGVQPTEPQLPTVETSTKKLKWFEDPAQLREMAATRPNTKIGQEYAKEYRSQADKLEEAEFKRRDLYQPVGGGVTFNKATNQYLIDGKPATSAQIQQIENTKAKSSASSVQIGDSALGLGKAAQTKVDEGLLDTTARLGRLSQIQSSYKPEFQEVGSRLGNTWTSVKDKLGMGVSGNDKARLQEFTQYKRKAIDNVNIGIKEATGASMGVEEAHRLMQAMPNPGTSWYDGDSPIEFQSKLDDQVRSLRLAEARLVYIKRNGMSTNAEDLGKQIPLERMPQIMQQREEELFGQLKSKKMNEHDQRAAVKRQLAQEFGLSAD